MMISQGPKTAASAVPPGMNARAAAAARNMNNRVRVSFIVLSSRDLLLSAGRIHRGGHGVGGARFLLFRDERAEGRQEDAEHKTESDKQGDLAGGDGEHAVLLHEDHVTKACEEAKDEARPLDLEMKPLL